MDARQRRSGGIDALIAGAAASLRAKSTGIRETVEHRGEKGRGHEQLLIGELEKLLPRRFAIRTGFVIGTNGAVSDQLDIVICDALNYPTFDYEAGQFLLPESVVAVISVKTTLRPSDVPGFFQEAERLKALMLQALRAPWPGIYAVLGYWLEGNPAALTDRFHAEILKLAEARAGVDLLGAIDCGPIGINLATFGDQYSLPPRFLASRAHIPGIATDACMVDSDEPFVDICKLLIPRLDPARLSRIAYLTVAAGEVIADGVTSDPRFQAAFAGKSADLILGPGMAANFQMFYANVGTAPWVRGTTTESRLAAAGPKGYALPHGWNFGWFNEDVYAVQSQDVVTPGSLATYSFNVSAPLTAAPGYYRFYGRPVIAGVGALTAESRANGVEVALDDRPFSSRLVMKESDASG